MPTVTHPAQSPILFELTQDQVLHIAASLASDVTSAGELMPEDFKEQHFQLFELFASRLSEAAKLRVFNALCHKGVLQ